MLTPHSYLMRIIMSLKFLTISAVILCASSATAAENAANWAPVFEFEGRVNSDRSLVSPKFLIPLKQDENSMLFTDIRSRLDDNASEEYNIGVGYRTINNDWIYGGYVFADYLNSENGNAYWQGVGGLEALSENWDLRINGYKPESTEHSIAGSTSLIIGGGGNFGISHGIGSRERALPGVDAEVGYKLPLNGIDLRVYGGGYYFDADGFDTVSGPKARAEITFNESNTNFLANGMELTFGVQYQNDGPREGTTTALAQLRIPFGESDEHSKLTPLEKRMTNFIRRDVDIVAGHAKIAAYDEAATVTAAGTGVQYTSATIINSSTPDPQTTVINAGPNAFILADGPGITGEVILLGGQALVGGGTSIPITGSISGQTILGTLPGERGGFIDTLTAAGGAGGFTIRNIEINSPDIGLYLGNLSNSYIIEDIDITAGTDAGILTNHSYNGTINNVTIHGAGNGGLVTTGGGGDNSNLHLSNITIENVTNGGGLVLHSIINSTVSNIIIGPNITGPAIVLDEARSVTGDAQLLGNAAGCQLSGNTAGSLITLAGGGTCP
jgi:hypothetical protein